PLKWGRDSRRRGEGRRRGGSARREAHPILEHMFGYAELHAHSAFSFLDGASQPEELVAAAKAMDLRALALTDHNGFYGAVRFAGAARKVGLPTVFGAELTLAGAEMDPHAADPAGDHLLVLARGAGGYRRLSRAMALGH